MYRTVLFDYGYRSLSSDDGVQKQSGLCHLFRVAYSDCNCDFKCYSVVALLRVLAYMASVFLKGVTVMAKYTERKTTGVQLREIDAVDVAIVLRLLETKKLTKAQWIAVRRLLSAYFSTD